MIARLFCILLLILCCVASGYSQEENPSNYRSDQIVIKVKPQTSSATKPGAKVFDVSRQLPAGKRAIPMSRQKKETPSILDGIYYIDLKAGETVEEALKTYQAYENVLYAEPIYLEELLSIPNDTLAHPETGSQYYLSLIKAYEAWDISTGNSDIIIGISDTGLDFEHDDIAPKVYLNPGEITNGIDDDNNGYVDDLFGYDLADGDNDAQAYTNYHGTRVAGVAAAATNNIMGIAGVGYNSSISPIKVFPDDSDRSRNAYESINYAADNGYDIINLSWGSTGSFSSFSQSIINYAVLEKDLIVVAAAGNTHAELDFYPASYDNVLSVGFTDQNDVKGSNATFSHNIDLVAPGVSILSTNNANTYGTDQGSSYAAPMVAGAAALVKEVYPHLNARQVMELIRVTTDDIYDVAGNEDYRDKLGSGRLNVYRALTQNTAKSVRASNFSVSGETFPGNILPGDTVTLRFDLTSFLTPVGNGTLTLSCSVHHISFTHSQVKFSFADSMETKQIEVEGLIIGKETPANTSIPIKLSYSEGNYQDFQYYTFSTAPDHLNFGNDKIRLNVGGNGDLGYPTGSSISSRGLRWNGLQIANYLGLIIGTNEQNLLNNAPTEHKLTSRDEDFVSSLPLSIQNHPQADLSVSSDFYSPAALQNLNVYMRQKVYAYEASERSNFLILEYRLTNLGSSSIPNLNAGMYIDWELLTSTENKAHFDSDHQMAYAYSEQGLHAGIKLFQPKTLTHQSIDLSGLNGNTPDLGSVFNDSIKYRLISENLFDHAGTNGTGNDIAQMISENGIRLNPNASKKVTFLIALDTTYSGLVSSIQAAEAQYERISQNPAISERLTSCLGVSEAIDPDFGNHFDFYSDPLATQLIATGSSLPTGPLTGDTIFYAINLDDTIPSDIIELPVELVDFVAFFEPESDTIYLDHPTTNPVKFYDASFEPISWLWNNGRGTTSTLPNPTFNFDTLGDHEITLSVQSARGCAGTFSHTIWAAERPPLPDIDDLFVCSEGSTTIQLKDMAEMAVFTSDTATIPIHQGTSFALERVTQDTSFFISQHLSGLTSLRKEVAINTYIPAIDFTFETQASDGSLAITLINTGDRGELEWIVNQQSAGTSDSLTVNLTSNQLAVTMRLHTSIGCTDSLSKTINLTPSPTPSVNFRQPCAGGSATLTPANGTLFGFYADDTLSQLIHTGAALTIDPIMTDTTIYIVGLDNGLPGNVATAQISPIHFSFDILASPNPLILSEEKNVTLSTTSNEIASIQWQMDGDNISTLEELTILILDSGQYTLQASATNEQGCEYTSSLLLTVLDQWVEPLATETATDLILYPNPSHGHYKIRHISEYTAFEIFDLNGSIIHKGSISPHQKSLNLSFLQKGTYLIQFPLLQISIPLVKR